MHVVPGSSVVVPLIIDRLPAEIDVLGRRWRRKREFHLTVVSASTLESAAGGLRRDAWDIATEVLSNRSIGPIYASEEVRRVRNSGEPELETLIVMAEVPGLEPLYRELSQALATALSPPPAHITVYSTDPARGIGLDDEKELASRAPALTPGDQREVREAMKFAQAFG